MISPRNCWKAEQYRSGGIGLKRYEIHMYSGAAHDFFNDTHPEVYIAEAPSDEVAAAVLLSTGSLGNVRTTTLTAFTEQEARQIIQGLPGG